MPHPYPEGARQNFEPFSIRAYCCGCMPPSWIRTWGLLPSLNLRHSCCLTPWLYPGLSARMLPAYDAHKTTAGMQKRGLVTCDHSHNNKHASNSSAQYCPATC
jgi:hypothetical protein